MPELRGILRGVGFWSAASDREQPCRSELARDGVLSAYGLSTDIPHREQAHSYRKSGVIQARDNYQA